MALSKYMLVGVESESTTYGTTNFTASLPSTYIAVETCDIIPEVAIIESQDVTNSASGRKHETTGVACDVNMTFKLTPRAAVETPPHWAPVLKASGFKETLVSGTVDYHTYKPCTANNVSQTPSMAVAQYIVDDNDLTKSRKFLARGVRGNLTLSFELGQVARGSFVGRGLYFPFPATETTVPAAGVNPEAGFSGELAGMVAKNMTITIASQTVCVEALEFGTNWSIGEDQCLNNDGSTQEVYLHRETASRMGGSMTLKGRAATLNTLLPYIASATEFAVSVEFDNGFTLTYPAVQFGNFTKNTAQGRINFDLPYFCNGKWGSAGNAGDNEVVIATGDGLT